MLELIIIVYRQKGVGTQDRDTYNTCYKPALCDITNEVKT